MTARAAYAQEAVLEPPALQIRIELLPHIPRNGRP
jgi:hypothetical protein